MFELTEKLKRLDISASKVIRLHRSLGDLQLALPGQQSQMATAYICAFSAGKGARVAIGLFMRNDLKVIYYLNGDGEVSSGNASAVLNEAIHFCESLGFMMSDEEIHKMDAETKDSLWEATPLKNPPAKPQPPAPQPAVKQPAAAEVADKVAEPKDAESDDLDLGLPRRKLAGSLKRTPPTPAELEKKRDRLRENLGRFLSSL